MRTKYGLAPAHENMPQAAAEISDPVLLFDQAEESN